MTPSEVDQRFDALVAQIRSELEATIARARVQMHRARLIAYWRIGRSTNIRDRHGFFDKTRSIDRIRIFTPENMVSFLMKPFNHRALTPIVRSPQKWREVC